MAAKDKTPPAQEVLGETASASPAAVLYQPSLIERVGKWLALVCLSLVALLGLLLIGLNSDAGRRFVVKQIEGLSFENGMKIGIGRIEGSLYGRMTLRELTFADPRGTFVRIPRAEINWRPFKFINGHIDVRRVNAEIVTLQRLPDFKTVPPNDKPWLPDYDIDIGKLEIANFITEPPVSGARQVARLSGSAHIADRRAQVRLRGATIAALERSGGDRIDLVIDAVPDDNRLALTLAVDAPRDGVLAEMIGSQEPLTIRLDGKGDWAAWNGQLNGNMGGSEFMRLALGARDGTFAVKGPTRIARLFSGPTAALLGPVTTIDMTAALTKRRAAITGQVASDAFALTTKGGVDLARNEYDGLNLDFALRKPTALAPKLAGRNLRARLRLDGGFKTPRADYVIDAGLLTLNDIGIERLHLAGAARVDADHILIPVTARAARITGLDGVAGGKLDNVQMKGDLAIDGTRILSDNMRIRSDRIDAGLVLVADTSTGLYTGAIDGRIDNYRVESVGLFNIETNVDLKSVPAGFALTGNVRARSTKLFSDGVRNFLGGNLVAATQINYGPDAIIRFANLRLTAPALRVTGGRGSYSPTGQINLVANGQSTKYGPIGVALAGTLSNPHAVVKAERPGLGVGLAKLVADIRGDPAGYRVNATGQSDYGPLRADVTIATAAGPLTLTVNDGEFGGVGLSGAVKQTAAGPFAGQLAAKADGLGGTIRLDAAGDKQRAIFNLRANNYAFPGPAQLAIGSAIIDGRAILYDRPEVIADIQLAQTRVGALNIAVARGLIDYRGGRGHAKLMAEGVSGAPFRVAANADLQPELWRVAIDGRMRGMRFKTSAPARIIPGKNSYRLLPTRVDLGGGHVLLAGSYGDGLKLQSRMERLDMRLANAFAPDLGLGGLATGSLDFDQASANAFPRADARLHIDGFTRTTAIAVSNPVDVNFVGKLLPDGGEARAILRQRGSVIGRMVASLRPLPPSGGTWTERLMAAPLSGGIRYNGPAETLFSFVGQADQSVSGPAGLAADFSGRVSQPALAGIVRGNNLVYENQTYGTRLSNMVVQGQFKGDRLEIEKLTATAGNGTVAGQGYISLAADSGYPMDVRLTLDNARLARSDALSGTATGTLALTKKAGEMALLSGKLRLPETRYALVRQGAAQIPDLSGVRFKPPRGRLRITGDEPVERGPGLLQRVRLNLELVAPEKLYVSGMGLESEWRANFTVSGTRAEPQMVGNFDLIRGTLGFASRSFTLTEGRVRFTGGQTIDPTITLAANDDIDDVTVTVNVTGRAFNPQIAFSSSPGLPQDEIVSRILFGSSIGNLSAIQAVQLAGSLNALSGSGSGGLNPLGKLRSAAGIDRLRILGPDEASGRGTALAAGHYLTDDIYIEIITDARGFTATQLEISLSRALSLLSQAGGSGVTNFSVKYKKNY